ncbi:MAG: hypothetical protein SPI35_02260 [Porphyromonas sp.]|nr:hypothetical protein [Porphyromonas sp.]
MIRSVWGGEVERYFSFPSLFKEEVKLPFIADILKYKSVAIVGLAKNTGKTVCLNYVLQRLSRMKETVAITSIGVDGELTDRVTSTPKPQITIYRNMLFVTAEVHYLQKRLVSEVLDISKKHTALGRLVTARAVQPGKVLISGPADTAGVRELIDSLRQKGVHTTIVDGALSRMSLASPAVTEGLILATGAAFSANIPQLIRKTKYVKRLIELPLIQESWIPKLATIKSGIWAIDDDGNAYDLEIASVFLIEKREKDLFRFGTRLLINGAISDRLLSFLKLQQRNVELIVTDFSKIFATQEVFEAFTREGNRMYSLLRSNLIAITANPYSPAGFILDSHSLCDQMSQELQIPVYDIKRLSGEQI